MTKLAILGAAGRMGGAIVRCCGRVPSLQLIAAVEQPSHPMIGQDAGSLAGAGQIGLPIADSLAAAQEADVWMDFTFHTVVPANVAGAARLGRALVVGTTGLDKAESQAVRDAARAVPVVWAPNMSLGVNLLFALAEKAAATLGLDYDAEIVETHHRHKKDAPSGTALHLAERVARGRAQNVEEAACYGRRGMVGERPRGQIGIHAVRAGDVVGDHAVSFSSEGERIELSHRATSRDAFAMGALRAAAWVATRRPGLYDMQDVLGL